jgi:fatty acid desaturase
MNAIKKYFGIVWMMAGPVLVAFMFWQAIQKISLAAPGLAKTNTILQWIIILLVFIPICMGLMLFGWYAWKNEYKILPEDSSQLEK